MVMSKADWEIIRSDERPPHLHQAIEKVLLEKVSSGERGPTIRFWEDTRKNVILGRFQSVRNEVREEKAKRDGIEISRRITGGGAMYVEPGSQITYSLYLPERMIESDSILESYPELDEFAVEGLQNLGYDVHYRPVNDISSPSGKVGGAAQTRSKEGILHHTRIAYELDIEDMVRYLRIGKEKISDKAIKSAKKAVSPLREQRPDIDRSEVVDALIASFSKNRSLREGEITREELEAAQRLVKEKFATEDWVYRFR